MFTRRILLVILFLALPNLVSAQSPQWQYRWQKDEVFSYKVKHVTAVSETVAGKKIETTTQLDLVKRWQVVEVDEKGQATLKLSLASMRNEQKLPNGDSLVFDSQNLEKSTPEMREQMKKFVGTTLAEIQVDRFGMVRAAKTGSLARYESDPPFAVVLPNAQAQKGQAWKRPFMIVLEPPQGTGEKYDAQQLCECKEIFGSLAKLSVRSELKKSPENPQDRLPLLQKENEGEVTIDLNTGRMLRTQLAFDRTVENHQGPGSSYRFHNEYTEELLPTNGIIQTGGK